MNPVRLPRSTTLFVDGDCWILNWGEHSFGAHNPAQDPSRNETRIGVAVGTNAITELEARQLARRYLLSRLPPGILAHRSQITLVEFVERRFLPEHLAGKKLPWRAHYHSILKHILSPEDCERLFGIRDVHAAGNRPHDPHWPYLGQLGLRDIRPHHVHHLIQAAMEKGYSPQTVRQIRSLLSAVFSYAKQELVFTGVNPTADVKLPDVSPKRNHALTLEQVEQVLGAMRYPEKQMTMIRLLTDMNVSEICGLQWKRVNLTGSWANVDGELVPPITIVVRKLWYRGELADVKQRRLRNISIPEALLPQFLLLRANANFNGPEDFVLTSRTGTAVNVSNITARRFRALSRTFGIPHLTLQALHRSHALVTGGPTRLQRSTLAAAITSDMLQ